ncbi:nicotinamide riboside kinase 2 [Platysternon megacephalum]|uniref:Nicotinamide riboside kinase 2 n=1 Tax=Platysternon megacephalum TaxID=55544 RepID=A0A4D9E1T8_9SAUR|nr:nicotinamide riboside kinase 2 [Platysternon megacephalum]
MTGEEGCEWAIWAQGSQGTGALFTAGKHQVPAEPLMRCFSAGPRLSPCQRGRKIHPGPTVLCTPGQAPLCPGGTQVNYGGQRIPVLVHPPPLPLGPFQGCTDIARSAARRD